jgi:hypothetical protein
MRFPLLRIAGIEEHETLCAVFSGFKAEKAALFSLQNNPDKWVSWLDRLRVVG